MAFWNFIIRLLASGIYILHRRALARADIRCIVFTGTSGKTLSRAATAYALRKIGAPLIYQERGYTNELGIVLSALGIQSIRLLSWRGLRKILRAQVPHGAYVCIEVGADWRGDTAWFLRRFKPWAVCITATTPKEWGRPLARIWTDKQALIANLPPGGLVCWSIRNPSVSRIRELDMDGSRAVEFTPSEGVLPYEEAFGCASAVFEALTHKKPPNGFFADFIPPAQRFAVYPLKMGGALVADTYKATPHCVDFVLSFALGLPAAKRIAIVSAMHPLWRRGSEHYADIGRLLQNFDEAYFVGPDAAYEAVRRYAKIVQRMPGDILEILKAREPSTVIVIKGAGRYHLERLVEEVRYT